MRFLVIKLQHRVDSLVRNFWVVGFTGARDCAILENVNQISINNCWIHHSLDQDSNKGRIQWYLFLKLLMLIHILSNNSNHHLNLNLNILDLKAKYLQHHNSSLVEECVNSIDHYVDIHVVKHAIHFHMHLLINNNNKHYLHNLHNRFWFLHYIIHHVHYMFLVNILCYFTANVD